MDDNESYREKEKRPDQSGGKGNDILLDGKSPAEIIGSLWIDHVKLAQLLGMSSRTVSRRRKDGTFRSFPIGKRWYSYLPDILELRYRFMK